MDILNEINDFLSNLNGVCDIKITPNPPADKLSISQWEKINSCLLPEDLKNFFLVLNGFSFHWKFSCQDRKFNVGNIKMNSLTNLVQLNGSFDSSDDKPSFNDLLDFEECPITKTQKPIIPNIVNNNCRLFILEELDFNSVVLLTYLEIDHNKFWNNPEIWLMDRSFRFHKLTNNFTEYFRLVIMHFGLPQWQFLFTDFGPSPQAKQFIHLLAPVRLLMKTDPTFLSQSFAEPQNATSPNIEKICKMIDGKIDNETIKTKPISHGSKSAHPR